MKRARGGSAGGGSAGGGSGGTAAELELAAPATARANGLAGGNLAAAGNRRARLRASALMDARSSFSLISSRFRPRIVSMSSSSGGPGGSGI